MKKNRTWFVIAAAVIINIMMSLTSCSEACEPELPEVIESEVFDKGIDNQIDSSPIAKADGTIIGTMLSYKSWIDVKGKTRAAFENRIEVTLTDQLLNVDTCISVLNFDLGECRNVITNAANGTRTDGFVTITDSVLICTLSFDNFSFDYKLHYETAVYNDGISQQEMPCHQIKIIKDNGYQMEDIDSFDDGEAAYARKIFRHSMLVRINDADYEVTANIILKRMLGPASVPYIKSSKLLSSKVTVSDNRIVSVLNIRQEYSDGTIVEKPVKYYPAAYIHCPLWEDVFLHNFNNDLTIQSLSLDAGETTIFRNECIICHRKEQPLTIKYNYFSVTMTLIHEDIWYDDGVLQCKFPNFEFGDVQNHAPELTFVETGRDTYGKYSVYLLQQTVTTNIDILTVETTGSLQIIAYDE